MTCTTNEPRLSPPSQAEAPLRVLPSEWIERLFSRFSAMYGARFADMWGGSNLADVKAVWAQDLGRYSGKQIAWALELTKTKPFPPTLPEFADWCRQAPRELPVALPEPKCDQATAQRHLAQMRAVIDGKIAA